jgi:membrane protein
MSPQIWNRCHETITSLCDKLHPMKQLLRFVFVSFWRNDHLYRASALTYGTLLSMVPLMMVSIPLLTIFPKFKNLILEAENYVFEQFIPATGKTVLAYLQGFAAHASQLSYAGLAALIITVIFMLLTIEDSLNHIWQVRHKNRAWWRLLFYWLGLSLAPLLIGVSLILEAYLAKQGWFSEWVVFIFPRVIVWIAFLVLYVAVPNCKVRFSHGVIGAGLAMVLCELAKSGFQVYLEYFPAYNLLYGAFATIPLFLFWVYIVWVLVLLGAEFTYALGVYHNPPWQPERDPLVLAVIALKRLQLSSQAGQPLTVADFIAADGALTEEQRKKMLAALVKAEWVQVEANQICHLGPAYQSQNLEALQQQLT